MRETPRKQRKRHFSDLLVLGIVILIFGGIGYLLFAPAPSTHNEPTTRVKVGDVAQNFDLPAANGGSVSLSAYRGEPVLLFFSEGVGCDPCWRQIVELQSSRELSGMNVRLIAITVDPIDNLRPIVAQWGIKVPVASDTSKKTVSAYDALNLGSMHPGQKPGHTFILVGTDGIIKWRYDLPESQASSGNMYVPTDEVVADIRKVLLGS